jgi:hypothetical protein
VVVVTAVAPPPTPPPTRAPIPILELKTRRHGAGPAHSCHRRLRGRPVAAFCSQVNEKEAGVWAPVECLGGGEGARGWSAATLAPPPSGLARAADTPRLDSHFTFPLLARLATAGDRRGQRPIGSRPTGCCPNRTRCAPVGAGGRSAPDRHAFHLIGARPSERNSPWPAGWPPHCFN